MTAATEEHALKQAKPKLSWPVRTHPTQILSGPGCIAGIGDELEFLDSRRVLVIASPTGSTRPTYGRLLDLLGNRCVATYTEAKQQTPYTCLEETLELARSEAIDGVVSLGGGSASDLAKAVKAVLGEGRPIEDLYTKFIPPDHFEERYLIKPQMPHASIPTTLGGADVAPGFGVKGPDNLKRIVRGEYVPARLVFLDPEASLDTAIEHFSQSGMNGLAHGIECLYSRTRNPYSEALAIESIGLFVENLPLLRERPDDLEVRQQLQWANLLGGLLISSAWMGIHHGVSHVLAVGLGLTHGFANSLMLPYVLTYNLEYVTPSLARAAGAMGVRRESMSELEAAQAAIDKVFEVRRAIGIPERLRDLPTPPTDDQLRGFADQAWKVERSIYFNPRPITSPDDVFDIYKLAY